MTHRIILAYPGGEFTLFRYRRPVPDQQLVDKLALIASDLFPSWDWSKDAQIPAIEPHDQNVLLMAVSGPSGKECAL